MSLVIVGSVALDSISTRSGSVSEALGGSAVYASIAASYFSEVRIVGVVGEDYPQRGIDILKAHNVGLDGLETVPGKTFRWSGKYEDWNHADTLLTELNVFAGFNPKLPPCCRNCRSLLLGNIHPSLQLQVLDQIDSYQWVACDTMNYWITGAPDLLEQVIRRVDIVFMNEDEIRQFTRKDTIFSAARDILERGVKLVVVKRGEYGSVCIGKDHMYFAPAYPLEKVVDPTGAGDCFAGGFMGYLATRDTLSPDVIREAVLRGTVLAAKDVSSFSVDGIIQLDQSGINTMIDQLKAWTR